MTLETYVRAEIARVALENGARYGGINNMLGVAMVLRNRVFAGWGSWIDVIEQVATRPTNLNIPRGDVTSVLKSNTGRNLLNQVDAIYSRVDIEDITGGALFWVDPSFLVADWFKLEVLNRQENHPRVAHIGPVWFYQ